MSMTRLWPLAWILPIAALSACGPKPPEHESVHAEGGVVRLSRAVVADGSVHFYTFAHEGRRVNFLVRTDGRGNLHTHLDACFSCYQYRRGFTVEAADLRCIACRYTYPLADEVWDYQGACAPIPIRFELEEQWILIEKRTLERAARYF
jgi:uncharacterized membrane protein